MTALRVERAGALATIQDLGRPGHAHLGVPRSGALDAEAAALANLLVGNDAGAAVIEATATGCAVRALAPLVAAVTGADAPVYVGAVAAPSHAPLRLAAGQVLDVGAPRAGMRSYVAVRGGVDVPLVLGSRSTDVLSGIGPAPLANGDELAVGSAEALAPVTFGRRSVPTAGPTVLRFRAGPRHDWLEDGALVTLASGVYTASGRSNRVGLRLDGPPLARARTGELASEGMVLGAIQVPPDGLPVVFLNDHPTTGGYPVIGVVDAASLGVAAQAAPGDELTFEPL